MQAAQVHFTNGVCPTCRLIFKQACHHNQPIDLLLSKEADIYNLSVHLIADIFPYLQDVLQMPATSAVSLLFELNFSQNSYLQLSTFKTVFNS
jgi:hypothetical protein